MAQYESSTQDRAVALRETLVSLSILGEEDLAALKGCLNRVAPEDVAVVLGDLDTEERLAIFKALPSVESRATVLEETDQQTRSDLLEGLSEEERSEVIGEMPVDDLVDALDELSEAEQERIIADLEEEDAEDVRELRQYEPDSAGGMMTPEFLVAPEGATSGEALATIQGNLNAEVISYVYVTSKEGRLKGVVSIRDLLKARPETAVEDHMETDIVKVEVETDREEVAAVVDKYNLPVIPVVDSSGSIRGIVTFDDVLDAVQDEHSEDMLRMAGTTAIHPYYEPIYMGVAKRLPFLLVTLTGCIGVLLVQERFKELITLPGLMLMVLPIVHLISGLSGNVAVVTSTVFVRGLATGEIYPGRISRAVWQELLIGLLIGLVIAVLVGLVLSLFFHEKYGLDTILVVVCGLFASIAWAAAIGALVPVFCRRFGIDPAIASGPFVTITVDISASFIFLLFVLLRLSDAAPAAG
ncbi:MAG: magnesium transporter [Planctomycetes bacterium]|nr:magnesium transporter [Planctomycetota bacterium]MCH2585075.1 magnesium transporter [Planctomycetota bacterium]